LATIRVILLTCRRPRLLRRALASLLGQTYTDWVCELHNDAPDDDTPRQVLLDMAPGDSRFTYHRHEPKWGPVASFNHCFRGGPELFATLLEDDNWWEPTMLASLLGALVERPHVALAWANMRVWQEETDDTWTDTGATIWPPGGEPRVFEWPVMLQAFDGLHSNGAMLFRKPAGSQGTVPETTPFALIEPMRERSIGGTYLLLPQVLANYSLTQISARSNDRTLWVQSQLLLAASFFEAVPLTHSAWEELWRQCRLSRPRRTSLLLLLALAGVQRREILSRAGPMDIALFAFQFVGSIRANIRGLGFRRAHSDLWEWLQARSAELTAERRSQGWSALDAGSPVAKYPPGSA
jgi:hypothetical protein